jgi:hypothetical protein
MNSRQGYNRFGASMMNGAAQKYRPNMQNFKPVQAQAASPLGWFSDLTGSDSNSYGSHSGGGYGSSPGSCFSLDICPDLILAAIAAAAAAAAFLIYNAIVAAGRRRKRSDGSFEDSFLSSFFQEITSGHVSLANFVNLGRYIFLHTVA